MATIKVKRNHESKGRIKLAWNKVYNAEINPSYKDSYIIGNNVYLSKWFTPVSDQKPKQKPVVKTDPKTGKLKVERDWSRPQAFPKDYVIPKGVRVVKVAESDRWVRKGSVGVAIRNSSCPFVKWKNEDYNLHNIEGHWSQESFELAPLNPADHPEHPDFGKVNRVVHTKDADVTTVDTTGTEQADESPTELPPTRDWSVPQAFPMGYIARKGDVIFMEEHGVVSAGTKGKIVSWYEHISTVEVDTFKLHVSSHKLAPLNPTDHPEHPDFNKANRVVHTKNADVTTIDTTEMEQAPKLYKELPNPKLKQDIRDTIAEYVRKYGHELTAIELIGHLTIDKQ